MPKTNYTKVESLIDKGLEKRFIEKLVVETGLAAGEKHEPMPKAYLLESIQWDIIALPEFDKQFFKKLGTPKKEITKLLDNPTKITDEEWKQLMEIRKKMNLLKKVILEANPPLSNEDLVEYERLRHINKRLT